MNATETAIELKCRINDLADVHEAVKNTIIASIDALIEHKKICTDPNCPITPARQTVNHLFLRILDVLKEESMKAESLESTEALVALYAIIHHAVLGSRGWGVFIVLPAVADHLLTHDTAFFSLVEGSSSTVDSAPDFIGTPVGRA